MTFAIVWVICFSLRWNHVFFWSNKLSQQQYANEINYWPLLKKIESLLNKAIAISPVLLLEKMWKLVKTCENLWKLVKTCENVWKPLETFENFWKLLKTFKKLTSEKKLVKTCEKNLRRLVKSCEDLWRLVKTCEKKSLKFEYERWWLWRVGFYMIFFGTKFAWRHSEVR